VPSRGALTLLQTLLQLRLSPAGTDVVGVALTAALATATPKRGEHACHVASHSRRGTVSYALTLAKGARDRFNEARTPLLARRHPAMRR